MKDFKMLLQEKFYSFRRKTFSKASNKILESEFDTYIQKAKKTVMDTRNHSAIKNVASELQDVQKIMGKNHIWLYKVAKLSV